MDRTRELFALLGNDPPGIGVTQQQYPSKQASASGLFAELAHEVAAKQTYFRRDLADLDKLARQKTIFDDKSVEIQTVTMQLKNGLTGIGQSLERMEQIVKTSSESAQVNVHRNCVLSNLKTSWINDSKEFTEILKTRSRNLEALDKRRSAYGEGNSSHQDLASTTRLLPTSASTGQLSSRKVYNAVAEEYDRSPDFDLESQQLVAGTHKRQMVRSAYHESRVEAVEQIQRVIGEVSSMFQRVAVMVGQQEEMVSRIDSTVDDSLTRLREGQAQLLKYFNFVANQRYLILKLLGMVLTFAIVFIVFLA